MKAKFKFWTGTEMLTEGFFINADGTVWAWVDYRCTNSFVLKGDLIQYTGLNDKNGKEIYEGDIVVCSYFKMSLGINLGVTEVDAELKGVIDFNDLSLCVTNIVSEKWSHYTGYDDGEGSCEITYLHDVYEGSTEAEMSIEVIGNIYENPELLTQKP